MFTRRQMAIGTLAALLSARSLASPALSVPKVDRLEFTILADGAVSNFATRIEIPGLTILPPPRGGSYRETFRAEWGYSLLVDAAADSVGRRILIDFGYTPETLASNMAILGIDPATVDALVLSHGHIDHFGGLPALLGKVRRGTPLFVGGEEAFCARLRGAGPDGGSNGQLERLDLITSGLSIKMAPSPQVVADTAFVTGRIPFVSPERPKVPTTMLPGQGCARTELDADRRDEDYFVDDAVHELGTAFHLKDKGLVVIGCCSHRGIINTIRAAQAASGIERVHAIFGGFHLVPPQTPAQAVETLALMRGLDAAFIFPGHCTGEAFIAPAIAQLPDHVFRTYVGSRIILS